MMKRILCAARLVIGTKSQLFLFFVFLVVIVIVFITASRLPVMSEPGGKLTKLPLWSRNAQGPLTVTWFLAGDLIEAAALVSTKVQPSVRQIASAMAAAAASARAASS